ncbi:EAL domain-containing protein [Pseudomonas sp. SA3-5]|uniref:EAL domain-containing protein n=1 Tax=Pseudomonas aestuarii TaxID=3018340 RepID=A0ABT4XK34_9PSED|nr:EAL domain-containing protein [Pseudomonas aestuarii]MDA7088586.1 EAL domain-containing protein [Pseudomonas aestuarii]
MLRESLDPAPVILIIDDQASNIRILREAVRDLGDVHFATNGETALQIAAKCLPDVVLLDIEMPGMDGYAVCRALKADPKLADAAIIFVTSHTRSEHELQALDHGGVDFVQKPLNVPIVRARIKTHIALRSESKKLALSQRNLQDVIHNLPAFIGYWGADSCSVFCNDTRGQWFGLTADAMHGQHLRRVMGEGNFLAVEPYLAAVQAGSSPSFDIKLRRRDGDVQYGQVTLVSRQADGRCVGFLMLITDITARKIAESALHDEKERIRVTLNSIGDAVVATDPHGIVTFVNPIAESLTGWLASEAVGQPIEAIMPLKDGGDQRPLQNPIYLALKEERVVGMALNCQLRRRDGRDFDVEDSAAPIRDQEGRITGAIVVFHDVSEARAMAIKMTHLANHDALTNLPNRMLLQDRIQQALQQARRKQERVALLLIDLDNFKTINDSIGHSTGDLLLQEVAQRLKRLCRSIDTVSRQGGDEFILLLPEQQSIETVVDIAENLRQVIAEPFTVDQNRYELSASIGISLFPDDSDTVEALYRHADSAMYQAKQEGRNRVRFFSADIEHNMRARHLLEQHMRAALEQGVFTVFYQAKVDARAQRIVGVEALIRWRTGDGSLVSPADFIPLAEETGLIIPIGRYVLQQACADARAWHEQGHLISVSVNISAVQFREQSFLRMVKETLAETGIRHDLLELEITEGVLARDLESSRDTLQALRKLGVRVAIDDFGTGYSSLAYLKRLPIDVLKIDQSFVRDMVADESDAAIIEAIIKLGHTLNLELVAEGVETHDQVQVLLALGCEVIQGYFYCRPIPCIEMEQLLERGLPGST